MGRSGCEINRNNMASPAWLVDEYEVYYINHSEGQYW